MRNLYSKTLIIIGAVFALGFLFAGSSPAQKAGLASEQLAFIRNGDIWLMNTDGSEQRPWVAGITNAKGRLSWSPDNKKLVFSRQGKVDIKFPEGGGGHHYVYDLFFAYIDSLPQRNNFWSGVTNILGAQAPDWSKNGGIITFTYDFSGNVVDAEAPDYTVGFYNLETKNTTNLRLPKDEKNLMALMPTVSPDGKQVCFVLAEFAASQIKQLGLAILPVEGPIPPTAELLTMAAKIPEGTSPAWSPDGTKILFMKKDGVYLAGSDLSGPKLVCHPEEGLWVTGIPSWSPGSDKIAFATSNGAIYTVSLDGTGMKRISGPGSDTNPAWTK